MKLDLDLQGKRERHSPSSLFPLPSQKPSRDKSANREGQGAGAEGRGEKGQEKWALVMASVWAAGASFKEPPRTWRELDFPLRRCLSSRLKTIFTRCGCLHANLSFRRRAPAQTPTEAYRRCPSFPYNFL